MNTRAYRDKPTEMPIEDRKIIGFCPVFGPILNQLKFFCRREKIVLPPQIDPDFFLRQGNV